MKRKCGFFDESNAENCKDEIGGEAGQNKDEKRPCVEASDGGPDVVEPPATRNYHWDAVPCGPDTIWETFLQMRQCDWYPIVLDATKRLESSMRRGDDGFSPALNELQGYLYYDNSKLLYRAFMSYQQGQDLDVIARLTNLLKYDEKYNLVLQEESKMELSSNN